jgi:hypothetical protein
MWMNSKRIWVNCHEKTCQGKCLPFLIISRCHLGKTHLSAVFIHNIEFHPNPCAWFRAGEFSGESWHIVIAIHDWVNGLIICDWHSLGYDLAPCCRISFGCAGTDKRIAFKVFFCGVILQSCSHTHTHTHTHAFTIMYLQQSCSATSWSVQVSVNYGSVGQWVHKEHSIKKWNQLQASQRIEAMKERILPKF